MSRRSPRLALAPFAIRGTIAKDDSRFVTAGSASIGTAGGAGCRPPGWRRNTFKLKGSLLITGRKQGSRLDDRFLQQQVGSSCETQVRHEGHLPALQREAPSPLSVGVRLPLRLPRPPWL